MTVLFRCRVEKPLLKKVNSLTQRLGTDTGEVCWGDGHKYDDGAVRALCVGVPLTTQIKGGSDEVPLPKVKFLPANDLGVAHVQGLAAVEHFRLGRRAGEFRPQVLANVRLALAYLLELKV